MHSGVVKINYMQCLVATVANFERDNGQSNCDTRTLMYLIRKTLHCEPAQTPRELYSIITCSFTERKIS